MISDSELRYAVERLMFYEKLDWSDGIKKSIKVLLELAKSHLSSGVEGVEKKLWPGNEHLDYCNCWNAALDAVKMAGYRRVPSQEEIAEVIKKSELWRMSNYVGRDDSSYSGINGTDKLARALVEAWEKQ